MNRDECTKRRFDKIGAMWALAQAKRKNSGEIRYYWCPICKAYHLTSQPEKDPNRNKVSRMTK
jgi:hypothetical protein